MRLELRSQPHVVRRQEGGVIARLLEALFYLQPCEHPITTSVSAERASIYKEFNPLISLGRAWLLGDLFHLKRNSSHREISISPLQNANIDGYYKREFIWRVCHLVQSGGIP